MNQQQTAGQFGTWHTTSREAARAAAMADGAVECGECKGVGIYPEEPATLYTAGRKSANCWACCGAGYLFPLSAA